MPSRLRLLLPLLVLIVAVGCKLTPPPYPRGQAPSPETLLGATQPRVDAISVPRARVVANRFARADLAFIAQAPDRFRGSITKAGNELVTLALHEKGYALRYKLDAFPQGFYEGPPDPCAVQALIGVELAPEGLVSLVLGGSPVISAPFTVLERKWDRGDAYEKLVIANTRHVQELRFDWVAGGWVFSGSKMYARGEKPSRWRRRRDPGELVWSLEHEDFERVDGAILPQKTVLRAPGQRRDDKIVITYEERDLHPSWARDPDPDDGAREDDDDAGDDTGWEDEAPADESSAWEEGEWEDEPEALREGEAAAPTEEAEQTEPPVPPPEETVQPKIPGVFRLESTGLTPRGDLCK